jgi:hypothetical protein
LINRQNIAGFLQGVCVLPVSALFGWMMAALFQSYFHSRWSNGAQIGFISAFALFPLAGSLKTRQKALSIGLITGLILTVIAAKALLIKP